MQVANSRERKRGFSSVGAWEHHCCSRYDRERATTPLSPLRTGSRAARLDGATFPTLARCRSEKAPQGAEDANSTQKSLPSGPRPQGGARGNFGFGCSVLRGGGLRRRLGEQRRRQLLSSRPIDR